ncbi:MAG: IS4 family transposase [Verrucomicrobia bacterium]|nr:IS4 family transposase [Verrucomicrobiota bacterium]
MLKHPYTINSRTLSDFQNIKPAVDLDPLWAFNEFANAKFNDRRLTSRLQSMAAHFVQQPLASIPQACGNWADAKGAYRFCSNEKVSFSAILSAHFNRTLQRLPGDSSVILCPQDTTTLNFIAHPATLGLGPVGTKPGKSLGMLLHSTLAVSPQGQFFGLLHAHCWTRPTRKKSRRARSRRQKKITEKESFRWLEGFRRVERLAHQYPDHQWVSVNDREGDIYELLQEATAPGHRAGLLVRARHDRSLPDQRGKTLFQYLRRLPEAGTHTVCVPRHENKPAREATMSIRFAQVSFTAPKHRSKKPSLTLWAVWAQEINPPAGQKPIQWCLLTTVPVNTLAEAIERIAWYVKRWRIEEFHRVLKSGCQVEARQLTTRLRLQRALAIDMVVAWRIMDLSKAARLQPEAPADRWLSTDQWQALYCYAHQTQEVPQEPPTIAQAVLWIAQLGGFLARKSDGQPGTTTLWRGLQRLNDIVASWRAFGPTHPVPPRPKFRRQKTSQSCG